MATPHSFGRLAIFLLILAFAVGVAPGAVLATRDRFQPSADPDATPFVTPTSTPAPPVTVDATIDDSTTPADSEGVITAPPVEEDGAPQANVRERPDAREIVLEPTPTPTPTEEPKKKGVPRLDDSVLRWLPEIMTSSAESGTPPELIAGVMRLESNGDPNIISPAGARGMMQILPEGLIGMGVPESLWHDPASNIRAGAFGLAQRAAAQGSWEGGVAAYFGFGCDVFGTCTEVYVQVAFSWAAFYAPAIADPYNSGYAILPDDWLPPPIAPYVEAAPPKVETPTSTTPTPGSSVTPTETATPTPGSGEETTPTDVPTDVPTELPTDVPTEAPTEIPPTVAPTEPAPPPDPTEDESVSG
jgi:hypothetical protein